MDVTQPQVDLLQTALWVVAVIAFVVFARRRIGELLDALVQRIVAGAPIGVGPVNIGSPPKSLRSRDQGMATTEGAAGADVPEDVATLLERKQYPTGLTESYYLLHTAQIIRPRSATHPPLYRVRVWIEADSEELLSKVERVTYRLHDTFPTRVIATKARAQEFELWLQVYGEFTVFAVLERADEPSAWVTRYLDLPGRPPE